MLARRHEIGERDRGMINKGNELEDEGMRAEERKYKFNTKLLLLGALGTDNDVQ